MDFGILFKRAGKVAAENSPAILTAIGVTGAVTTALLAAKAAFKSVDVLKEAEEKKGAEFRGDNLRTEGEDLELTEAEAIKLWAEPLNRQEKFEAVWKLYVPAAGSLAITVAAIICANRIQDRRNAAILSAFSAVEKSFQEYRGKTTEKVGKNKEQGIRDELAQERVDRNPYSKSVVIMSPGRGTTRCFDAYSSRYFYSDAESIRKAVNDANSRVWNAGYISLTEFWEELGIPGTSHSDDLGWNSDKLIEIEYPFSAVVSEENEPCLELAFRTPPQPKYDKVNRGSY